MSKRLLRKIEVKELKSKVKELMQELGVSKSLFKRTLPKVSGQGYEYTAADNGHKQSLRQQYLFLQDLIKYKNEKKEMVKKNEN